MGASPTLAEEEVAKGQPAVTQLRQPCAAVRKAAARRGGTFRHCERSAHAPPPPPFADHTNPEQSAQHRNEVYVGAKAVAPSRPVKTRAFINGVRRRNDRQASKNKRTDRTKRQRDRNRQRHILVRTELMRP